MSRESSVTLLISALLLFGCGRVEETVGEVDLQRFTLLDRPMPLAPDACQIIGLWRDGGGRTYLAWVEDLDGKAYEVIQYRRNNGRLFRVSLNEFGPPDVFVEDQRARVSRPYGTGPLNMVELSGPEVMKAEDVTFAIAAANAVWEQCDGRWVADRFVQKHLDAGTLPKRLEDTTR